MYRRQGSSQKRRLQQTEVKGRKWSRGTEVTSSRSLLSGAGVRWLAAPPAELRVCAVRPTPRRSDPGCRLGCSGRFSWRPPGRRPQRSLRWEESGRSYSGHGAARQRRRLPRHPARLGQPTKAKRSLPRALPHQKNLRHTSVITCPWDSL